MNLPRTWIGFNSLLRQLLCIHVSLPVQYIDIKVVVVGKSNTFFYTKIIFRRSYFKVLIVSNFNSTHKFKGKSNADSCKISFWMLNPSPVSYS